MFLDSFLFPDQRRGWIEVICGSMFSGKTEELIRRVKRAQIANQPVALFKPNIDTRYDEQDIISHDNNRLKSIPIACSSDILKHTEEVTVVGIDEVQFFDQDITDVAEKLANSGKRVVVAGLDMNYKGEPFGEMPNLLARAEFITKLHAICDVCGSIALHSYRKSEDSEELLLGEKENYEPRCRICYKLDNT